MAVIVRINCVASGNYPPRENSKLVQESLE